MKFKNLDFTEDKIYKLLETLGFTNITNNEKEFKFSWYDGSSPNGTCLFKNKLFFIHWSTGRQGDIIELIKYKLECTYKECFRFIEQFMNEKLVYKKVMTPSIFESYLEELRIQTLDNSYEIYDDRMLLDYKYTISELFLKDGVNTLTQYKFGLIYDEDSSRIGIPIRDKNGGLVGILGRFNYKNVSNGIPKYLPIIRYQKALFLFGLYENKEYLKDTIYIVESEKSVLQAYSMGIKNVVALGTCRISSQQKQLIEESRPQRVVLLLDEGLQNKYYEQIAKDLLPSNSIYTYKVQYINANDCGMGSKNCIFDESIDKVNWILNNKLIDLN